jgi:predicted ATPase
MYIDQISVENLKCFKGQHTISLKRPEGFAQWVVIAGRNGTGKTTLLKAIAVTVVGTLSAFSLERSFRGWISYTQDIASVQINLVCDSRWDQQSDASHFLTGLAVNIALTRVDGSEYEALFSRIDPPGMDLSSEERILRFIPITHGPWASAPKGWFICGYGPFRHLGPASGEQLRLNKDAKLSRLINLFSEGATLVESVEWLQHLHMRALEGKQAEARLKAEVLKLLNDGLLPDGSAVEDVDSDGLWIRRGGERQLLHAVSDGYRTVAALVLDMVRHLYGCYGGDLTFEEMNGHWACALPGVVLIDEVDAHMHISWQQRIGFWLCDHFPGLQFIVTTHSPFICQAASPGALIRLPAPGEDRQIEVVPENIYKVVTQGTVDAAVITELFGLEHAHSPRAEQTRERLAALEARLLNDETLSPEEEAEWERLKQTLPETLSDLADQQLRAALYEED